MATIDWGAGLPRVLREGFEYRPYAYSPFGEQTAGYYKKELGQEGNPDSWRYVGSGGAHEYSGPFGSSAQDNPFRPATWQELQQAGLWNDLGKPTAPLWQKMGFSSVMGDPNKYARVLLGLGIPQNELATALQGQGLSPQQLGEIQGTITARQQAAADSGDFMDQAGDFFDKYALPIVGAGLFAGAGAFGSGASGAGSASTGGTAAASAPLDIYGSTAGNPGWLNGAFTGGGATGGMISTEQALLSGQPAGTTLESLAAPPGFFPGPGGGMGAGTMGGGNALQQQPGTAPGGSAINVNGSAEPLDIYGSTAGNPGWVDAAFAPTAGLSLPFGLTWKDLALGAARGLPGLAGALASNKQADQYQGLADQYMAAGEPSRQRFEASFSPGFSMSSDAGFNDALNQAAKATLHGLSVNGNPAQNPNAWSQALQDLYQRNAYNALQEYRRMNAGAGGLSALTPAGINAQNNALSAGANVYGALGGAAADIFNPPKSLEQLLREIGRGTR